MFYFSWRLLELMEVAGWLLAEMSNPRMMADELHVREGKAPF